MPASRIALLRWQFDLTWSLFEFHLDLLRPEDFHWIPAGNHWTMRPTDGGDWEPDWADTEPDPIPVPTVAWLTWHIDWWWTVTLHHLRDQSPPDRTDIRWPGPGLPAIDRLRCLRTEWIETLAHRTDADLDTPATFPWRDNPDLTVAHTIAWVDTELTKNAAEIGQLRLLRAAR